MTHASAASVTPHGPSPADASRAGRSALLAFVTNGALVGSLLPRYPEIADALDLSTARLGLVVVCFAVGAAMAGKPAAGAAAPVRHAARDRDGHLGHRVRAVARGAVGGGRAVGDVVVRRVPGAGGLRRRDRRCRAERAGARGSSGVLGRSVLSRMHAGWSAGAAVAGVVGTVAASLGVPLGIHLALSGIVLGAMAAVAGRGLSRRPGPVVAAARRGVPREPIRTSVIAASIVAGTRRRRSHARC